jgi:hypothetical protein
VCLLVDGGFDQETDPGATAGDSAGLVEALDQLVRHNNV